MPTLTESYVRDLRARTENHVGVTAEVGGMVPHTRTRRPVYTVGMRNSLMVVAIGGAAAAYVWQQGAPVPERAEHDTRLLKDRVWIDHMPAHDRDKLNLFIALTPRPRQGPQGPFGLFENVSPWEGHFEAFRYESQGEEMRIVFPQSGDRETLTVKPRKCSEQGMDYCLEVSGSTRGVSNYYSRKGWEVRTAAEAQALAAQLAL